MYTFCKGVYNLIKKMATPTKKEIQEAVDKINKQRVAEGYKPTHTSSGTINWGSRSSSGSTTSTTSGGGTSTPTTPPTTSPPVDSGKIQPAKKPQIYYSSVPGWTSTVNPNAEVVYIDKRGRTTGKTSSGLDVPAGFDVSAKYYKEGKSGATVRGSTLLSQSFAYVETPVESKTTVTPVTPPTTTTQPAQKESFLGGLARKGAFTTTSKPSFFERIITRNKPRVTTADFVFGTGALVGEKTQNILRSDGFAASSVSPKSVGDIFAPTLSSTGRKVKESAVGFAGRSASYLVPSTKEDVAITAGSVVGYPFLPGVAKIGVSTGVAALGTKGALNSSLTPEQRVASGTLGVLGASGVAFETIPYIRGIKARASKDFKPVKVQPEGFKAVSGDLKVPAGKAPAKLTKNIFVKETGFSNVSKVKLQPRDTIGLIPEGSPLKTGLTTDVKLPSTSPLKRGGFGVKPSEKAQFLGENQVVGTSQQSFFKTGKNIPLEREFFVTPADPTTQLPVTRVSRLGLSDPLKIPDNPQLVFGLPSKAQIGIERGASVTRSGRGNSFKLGGGSELEGIKLGGSITDVRKTGATSIRGQGVELFEFTSTPGKKLVSVRNPFGTSMTTQQVSGTGLLGTAGATSLRRTTSFISPSRTIRTPTRSGSTRRSGLTGLSFGSIGTSFKFPPTRKTPPPTRRYPPSSPFTTSSSSRRFTGISIRVPPGTPPTFIKRFKRNERRSGGIALPKKRKPFRPPRRLPSLFAITQNVKSSRPFRLERSSISIRPILTTRRRKSGKKKK